jgi:hypothetical protein
MNLERTTKEGDSPVAKKFSVFIDLYSSTTEHVKFCGNLGGPPPKAKYSNRPIVNKYREGKAKRTPEGE